MIKFRRAKSAETLDVMFHGHCRKNDLKIPTNRNGTKMSYQCMAEYAHEKGIHGLYFAALAGAHRAMELTTGVTQDFVIDRLVIGRDASAGWIIEAREVMFRAAFNNLEDK
jgi:hypothetical protein